MKWYRQVPSGGTVSHHWEECQTHSAQEQFIAGLKVDYNKHCQLEFGTYVQTHEESNNTMASRTTGAIAMRPTGNEQGGHYFFSLNTGRRLNRNRWTVLPMPNEVIERVHHFANSVTRGLTFGNRDGNDDTDPYDSDGESYNTEDESDDGADDESVDYDDDDGHDNGHLIAAPIVGVNGNDNDMSDEEDSEDALCNS